MSTVYKRLPRLYGKGASAEVDAVARISLAIQRISVLLSQSFFAECYPLHYRSYFFIMDFCEVATLPRFFIIIIEGDRK